MNIDSLAKNWWALALRGVAAIIFGVLAFVLPSVTLAVLTLLFGGYALVEGALNIVAAIRLRRRITGEAWLVLNGILSIVFGALTMLAPGAGALSLAWLIGAYAIGFGALLLGLSFRLRGWRGQQARPIARAA